MAESAFIVEVPQAEFCVGALRERYDASAKLGVPAHITVLVPFMAPERVSDTVLARAQQALGAVPAFSFSLSKWGRFPQTAYLAPEPAQPFVELTQNLMRCFPEYPPFRGEHDSIVPHLTVAHGSAPDAEVAAAELVAALQAHGPIHAMCR
jgi:2'-5' RNA ligase